MKKTSRTLAEFREEFEEYLEKQKKKESPDLENMMEEKRRKLLETISMDASEYYILLDLVEFLKARQVYDETFEI